MTSLHGSDLADLRQLNSRAVLACLYGAPDPLTVRELADATRLSRPTVEATLTALLASGHAQESTRDRPAGRGRPARAYRFAADAGVTVGLDIGPHGITGLLGDLRGAALHEERRTGIDLSSGAAAFDALTGMVDSLLANTPHTRADIVALAVGVPGVVDSHGEIALTRVVPDWVDSDIPARIRAAYPKVTIDFDNDAKLAALAELEWGAARGADNAIFVLVGRRIAAATVVDGRLARGSHGAAGEIGALPSLGWAAAYERMMHTSGDRPTALAMFTAAAAGDASARLAVEQFAGDIAAGLAALTLAIDPDRIIIGGGIAQAGGLFLDHLAGALEPLCLFRPQLVTSELGQSGVARGALARAVRRVREDLLDGDHSPTP